MFPLDSRREFVINFLGSRLVYSQLSFKLTRAAELLFLFRKDF